MPTPPSVGYVDMTMRIGKVEQEVSLEVTYNITPGFPETRDQPGEMVSGEIVRIAYPITWKSGNKVEESYIDMAPNLFTDEMIEEIIRSIMED